MSEEKLYCQSCSMPLENQEVMGTEPDGSKNYDYCVYCYAGGKFTNPDMTLEEMILDSANYVDEWNKDMGTNMTAEEVMVLAGEIFPKLKRWQQPSC